MKVNNNDEKLKKKVKMRLKNCYAINVINEIPAEPFPLDNSYNCTVVLVLVIPRGVRIRGQLA